MLGIKLIHVIKKGPSLNLKAEGPECQSNFDGIEHILTHLYQVQQRLGDVSGSNIL